MLPLAGIRVVDLSRILTGPFASMILSDFGADIIKVEAPGHGDDTRAWGPPFLGEDAAYFLAVNRNKRSLTLDLKRPAGREVLERLVRRADVLIENFRPGTMERLGFGPEACRRLNPGLVYARITGYGSEGPYRERPGYDVIAQGMSGLEAVTGEEGGPPVRVGFSVGDIGAGMYAVIGILLALGVRERTGRGQFVETSLLGTLLSWQTYHAQNYFATGEEPRRLGSRHPNIVPYQAFAAKDGWLNVAVGNEPMWERFVAAVDLPELGADPRFSSNKGRVEHREALVATLAPRFREKTVDEWLAVLEAHGVPAGPILGVGEAWADPGVKALGLLTEVDHPSAGRLPVVGTPLRLSETPARAPAPPPRLGQHRSEILAELGYSGPEIERLVAEGVV